MNDLRIEPLADGLWALDEPGENSMYLVEGRDRAILIDTGVGTGPLMPALRRLTDKPIDLALTHAHVDHMYRAGEFECVYLHPEDIAAWRWPLKPLFAAGCRLYSVPWTRLNPAKFIPLGDVLDPGGCPLRVIHVPGDTPGSVIFQDDRHRALFTGDAFGSGEAAWMWLPGCFSVSGYRDALKALLPRLEPLRDYRFLGGHRLQGIPSERHPHAHPLTLQVPRDMLTLCDEMLTGRETGKPVRLMPMLHLRVYSHGHAGMVQRRSKVH